MSALAILARQQRPRRGGVFGYLSGLHPRLSMAHEALARSTELAVGGSPARTESSTLVAMAELIQPVYAMLAAQRGLLSDYSASQAELFSLIGEFAEARAPRFDTGVSLDGQSFADQDLIGRSFRGTSLRRSNFRHARLIGADFERADLSGADLRGADLRGARLVNAVLIDANLSETSLFGTDFSGADLTDARFDGAFGLKSVTSDSRTAWPADRYRGDTTPEDRESELELLVNQASSTQAPLLHEVLKAELNIDEAVRLRLTGLLLLREGKLVDATVMLEHSRDLGDAFAWRPLAYALRAMGRVNAAVEVLEERASSRDLRASVELALLLLQNGDATAAHEVLRRAVEGPRETSG